jgi:hypothetical protein
MKTKTSVKAAGIGTSPYIPNIPTLPVFVIKR